MHSVLSVGEKVALGIKCGMAVTSPVALLLMALRKVVQPWLYQLYTGHHGPALKSSALDFSFRCFSGKHS